MDIDKALVVAVLREGKAGLRRLVDKGVSLDWVADEGGAALKFIVEYTKKNGVLPEQEIVSLSTKVALDSGMVGTVDFWADAVMDRHVGRKVEDAMMEVAKRLVKPQESLQYMGEFLREMRKERIAGTLVESLPALGQSVIEYYERIKKGETGIPAPWPSINEATLGFWPEDLALFVARLGIGKTWTSIMLAGTAWESEMTNPDGTKRPCRVLYATTEMAKERIAMRWYAIKLKLPYKALRTGKLGTFLEKKLYDGVKQFCDSPNFNIVGGNFDFSMESFDAAIEECNADIVVLDGAYLLKVQGLTRQERAANAFDELKRINKRRKVPILVTMQFNREVKTNQAKTVDSGSIALTDVAGWNADLIYGLVQTDEMRKNRRMTLKPLKIREGESTEIECNWDFDTMNFAELPRAAGTPGGSGGGGGGSDAAELDSGQDPFAGNPGDVPF
jgi:replicative DNA helicase